MVKVREDMTGWVMSEHGVPDSKLTVLKQTDDYVSPGGKHMDRWICECNCNDHNIINVIGTKLKQGIVKSCGCVTKELIRLSKKKYNKYSDKLIDEHGEYYIGYCSNTEKEFYVDVDDFPVISQYCWHEVGNKRTGYNYISAKDSESGKNIKMHWLIVGKYYDHQDRNPFNNRKYNLRPANASQNNINKDIRKNNTSRFAGVSFHKGTQKWQATISINKKPIYLGTFDKIEDAIVARLNAEKEYYGEWAPQKHLFEQYKIN